MRSAVSSWVGGGPEGTTTVGAVPAVPADERSCAGIEAIVDDVAALFEAGGEDTAVVLGVAVVAGGTDVVLQAASVTVAADKATNDELRRRDTGQTVLSKPTPIPL